MSGEDNGVNSTGAANGNGNGGVKTVLGYISASIGGLVVMYLAFQAYSGPRDVRDDERFKNTEKILGMIQEAQKDHDRRDDATASALRAIFDQREQMDQRLSANEDGRRDERIANGEKMFVLFRDRVERDVEQERERLRGEWRAAQEAQEYKTLAALNAVRDQTTENRSDLQKVIDELKQMSNTLSERNLENRDWINTTWGQLKAIQEKTDGLQRQVDSLERRAGEDRQVEKAKQ